MRKLLSVCHLCSLPFYSLMGTIPLLMVLVIPATEVLNIFHNPYVGVSLNIGLNDHD